MRSKQLQPMGSRSSQFLYVPHHNMKQGLQTITGFLVTTLDPKCTALQFSYLTSPLFPCLQMQNKLSIDLIRKLTNMNKKDLQICKKANEDESVLFERLGSIFYFCNQNCAFSLIYSKNNLRRYIRVLHCSSIMFNEEQSDGQIIVCNFHLQ